MVSKKLLLLSIVTLVLTFGSYFLDFYLSSYLMRFNWWYITEFFEIKMFFIVLGIIVLVSWLVSYVRIGRLNGINKFLLIFSILCGLFFCIINFNSFSRFFETQKEVRIAEKKYSKQAEKDIKNDFIIFEYAGGLSIPEYDRKTYQNIDSIRKNYGIKYENTGCVVDFIEKKGQDKYEEIVIPYLEKRNGKGWENRMKNEIEKLKKIELRAQK